MPINLLLFQCPLTRALLREWGSGHVSRQTIWPGMGLANTLKNVGVIRSLSCQTRCAFGIGLGGLGGLPHKTMRVCLRRGLPGELVVRNKRAWRRPVQPSRRAVSASDAQAWRATALGGDLRPWMDPPRRANRFIGVWIGRGC
jgi:hypothetical protein